MDRLKTKRYVGINLILPIVVWILVIVVFLNVKNIPFSFSEKDAIVLGYFVKFVMTIIFPMVVIDLIYKNKRNFGVFFSKFSSSFKLSLRAYTVAGPAGITFLLIGIFGWGFDDWIGSFILTVVYFIAFYFVLKVTAKLPSRRTLIPPNKQIAVYIICSLLTIVFTYFTYATIPWFSKILYYIFIVGLGEELLFRGYIQSSFNVFFGKPFRLGNVNFGWGLIVSALLFGMMHALVVVPPLWPWALFTFALGLILGFVREKDGTILSAIILHAMLDMPLVFFNV